MRWQRESAKRVWWALGGLVLMNGCANANEIVPGEVASTELSPQAESTKSTVQVTTGTEVIRVEPADILAAFRRLDFSISVTERLTERFEVDGEVVELRETVVSDLSSDAIFVLLDHSELTRAILDDSDAKDWSHPLLLVLFARGLVPRQYIIEDGVAWTTFGPERETQLATAKVLLAFEGSPQLEEQLAELESGTAPMDKWIGLKIEEQPLLLPGVGGLFTYRSATRYVTGTWLQDGVELEDLRIIQQSTVGDRTIVEISDGSTTTLQLEFDQHLRLRATEQDLSQSPSDAGPLWRRIELDWEVDLSLLELPAEEDRFNAIDMFASIGLDAECVPEGVATVAELEAIPELTEVLSQECIDQSLTLQAGQAAARKLAEAEAATSDD